MLKRLGLLVTVFIVSLILSLPAIANICKYPFWLEGQWNGNDTILLSASPAGFTYGNIDLNKEMISEETTGLRYYIKTETQTLEIQRISNECIRIIVTHKDGNKESGIFYRF